MASAIACSVLTTENFSIASNTLPRRRSPAVSIRSKRWPARSNGTDDRVARRPRLVESDQPLLAEPGIDERRLADVRTAGDREPDRCGGVRRGIAVFRLGAVRRWSVTERRLERGFGERDDALPMRRRDRLRLAEAELEELGQERRLGHALGLVGSEHDALARAAQVAGDVVVVRRRSGAHVDDEDDRVGLGDRLLCLARHQADDAGRVLGIEAAGVDDDELVPADLRVSVVAVARQAGEVGDDRVARSGPVD